MSLASRGELIMLKNLSILLCCTAQRKYVPIMLRKCAYYAQNFPFEHLFFCAQTSEARDLARYVFSYSCA